MKDVIEMAGRTAAHAIWSICDGETLIPMVSSLKENGQTNTARLMMGSADAMSAGNKQLNSPKDDDKGIAFIYDGYANLDSGRIDSLIIDVNIASDKEKSIRYMIPYRHASHKDGFAVHRLKLVGVKGIPESEFSQLSDSFFDGLESHEQGSKIWNEHYVDQAGATASEDEGGKFSGDNYQKILNSPYLIFILVAASDGTVDKKEMKEFIKILSNPEVLKNPLMNKLITDTISSAGERIKNLLSTPTDFIEELASLKEIIDQDLDELEANNFKISLFLLGKQIAEASGGFFGFGSKISKEEKAALTAIAVCLDIKQH